MNPETNTPGQFCARCGQQLPAAARFCRACGAPAAQTLPPETDSSPATEAFAATEAFPAAQTPAAPAPPAAPETITAWAADVTEEPEQAWTDGGTGTGPDDDDEKQRRSPWLVTAMIAAVVLVLGAGAYFGYGYLTSGDESGSDQAVTSRQPSPSAASATAAPTPAETSPAKATASASPSSSPTSSPRPTATAGPPSGNTGSYGAAGWDTGALNAAYCQHDGEFVTVADSPKFQGIICMRNGGMVYRGLDKSNGLTMSTGAQKTPTGYAGVLGNTRYEISPAAFTITLNGDVIASDKVTTYVTPDQDPFRPGDLGLAKPIDYPQCDGSAAVLLVSSFGAANAAAEIKVQLEQHPGARYLRTDLSCDGFNRTSDDRGNREPIYAAYLPAGSDTASACAMAEANGTYAVWLQNGFTPEESRVNCP